MQAVTPKSSPDRPERGTQPAYFAGLGFFLTTGLGALCGAGLVPSMRRSTSSSGGGLAGLLPLVGIMNTPKSLADSADQPVFQDHQSLLSRAEAMVAAIDSWIGWDVWEREHKRIILDGSFTLAEIEALSLVLRAQANAARQSFSHRT